MEHRSPTLLNIDPVNTVMDHKKETDHALDIDNDVSKSKIKPNSFNRCATPGVPEMAIEENTIDSPESFNKQLRQIGVFNGTNPDYEELQQFDKYNDWSVKNFDTLRDLIKAHQKCKYPQEKSLLVKGIREVIKDINASKAITFGGPFEPQTLIARLVDCNVFLTAKEKETFFKWTLDEFQELDHKIYDCFIQRLSLYPIVNETDSAKELRDFILKINYQKELHEQESALKGIQENTLDTSLNLIKDLVEKLRAWGVIENNTDAVNLQSGKCKKWSYAELNFLKKELDSISERVLLFEELSKSQIQHIKNILNKFNNNILFGSDDFKIWSSEVKPATFKYANQADSLATSAKGNEAGSTLASEVTIKGDSVNLVTPKLSINGEEIDLSSFKKKDKDEDNAILNNWYAENIDPWENVFKDIKLDDDFKVFYHSPVGLEMFTDQSNIFNWNLIKKESRFVTEAKKAGIRVAATQANKVTKGLLTSALPGEKSAIFQQFLDSELGTAFVSMINGAALTYGMKNNETAQIMAKEFRVSSIATAGNFVADEILELITNVVADALAENIDKKSENENNDQEIEISLEDIEEEKLLKA